jgi:isopentenyl diphosphate isomerase/L-lactate dehydrogenase-like FMN-dependent dehydrogenase
MMVSPPERDLSIELFGKHLASPMFMAPIGLVGLCAPDFHGDVAVFTKLGIESRGQLGRALPQRSAVRLD